MATAMSFEYRRRRWERIKRAGVYFALVVYVAVADWAIWTLAVSAYRVFVEGQ